MDRRGFVRDVGELGHARLHAIGHLVRRDTRIDLRIANLTTTKAVQIADEIDRAAARVGSDALRIRDEEHGIALRPELDALVDRRQESAPPARLAAVWCVFTREQHDKSRQVVAIAAQSVRQPCAHAGPAEHLAAGVHEKLTGRVIELRRVNGADDGDVVGDVGQMRKQLGQLRAGLAIALEVERRTEEPRRSLDEREPLPLRNEFSRYLLAVVLLQRGLVVEQIELRGRPGHEQIDDVLRLGREVRRPRHERSVGLLCEQPVVDERRQRQPSDAESGLPEKMPPCDGAKNIRVHHSFVSASSRFRSAFATSVQAACSAGSTPGTA